MLSDRFPVLLFPVRLETRFVGNQLKVRIYPDHITVETHERGLTAEEIRAGREYFQALESGEGKRDAWEALATELGAGRAAWVVKRKPWQFPPEIMREKADTWTEPPTIRVLPTRFHIRVYKGGRCVDQQMGAKIEEPALFLPLNPNAEDNGSEDFFDSSVRWMSDYEEAEAKGMAVTVKLQRRFKPPLQTPFDKIIAVGVNEERDPQESQRLLEELLENHHYSEGLGFLPHDTPTNNTRTARSGFSDSEEEDKEKRFEIETKGPVFLPSSYAVTLGKALGFGSQPQVFSHIAFSDGTLDSYARPLQGAVWPAQGDYLLRALLQPMKVSAGSRWWLWKHFQDHVRARGPLPTLRVGDLPYGILPVSKIQHHIDQSGTETERTPWTVSSLETPNKNRQTFERVFFEVIQKLFGLWKNMAVLPKKVPTIGTSKDPDGELVRILGMQSGAAHYIQRPVIDNRFIGDLLFLFAQEFFGDATPYGQYQRVNLDDWKNQFIEAWDRKKTEAMGVFQFLAKIKIDESMPLGTKEENQYVTSDDLQDVRLRQLISWGNGGFLEIPLVGDLQEERSNPLSYLSKLLDWGSQVKESAADAVLFEMLRNAFIFDESEKGKEISSGNVVRANTQELWEALAKRNGEKLSVKELENLFRDSLDLCTHRLDAWVTSFPNKRLKIMRDTPLGESGIHLGMYGWVENLNKKENQPGSKRPGEWVHAPSPVQATAGAILRHGFLSHKAKNQQTPFRINLESTRVRQAMWIIKGVQEGQDLGGLLGMQFERELHERELDQYIPVFRTCFPMVVRTTASEKEEDSEQKERNIPRRVTDGHKLVKKIREWEEKRVLKEAEGNGNAATAQDDPRDDILSKIAEKSGNQNIPQTKQDKMKEAIHVLEESFDAVTDVLLYEGMYQWVSGSAKQSGLALDALSGKCPPPKIESIRTKYPTASITHRVCMVLDAGPKNAQEQSASSPRGLAEPCLHEWMQRILGLRETIWCKATFEIEDDEGKKEEGFQEVSMVDLGLEPLDWVYLSSVFPAGEDTELERRVRFFVRNEQPLLQAESPMHIDFSFSKNSDGRSMMHALQLGKCILDLFGESQALSPPKLCQPEYAEGNGDPENPLPPGQFAREDCHELARRVNRAKRSFDTALVALRHSEDKSEEEIVKLLLAVSEFGIKEAIPNARKGDTTLRARVKAVVAVMDKRLEKIEIHFGELTNWVKGSLGHTRPFDQTIKLLTQALKALFGEAFVVLPTFSPPHAETLTEAFSQTDLLGNNKKDRQPRFQRWFHQATATHSKIQRLEDVQMMAKSWQKETQDEIMSVGVAQLPLDPSQRWVALTDEERWEGLTQAEKDKRRTQLKEEGRPSGTFSLVTLTSGKVDWVNKKVAGFLVEEWFERIPKPKLDSGIAFHFDQPNAQAPQACLLAVPPKWERRPDFWDVDDVIDIVHDTFDLAKVRLVDVDAFKNVGCMFPTMFIPTLETKDSHVFAKQRDFVTSSPYTTPNGFIVSAIGDVRDVSGQRSVLQNQFNKATGSKFLHFDVYGVKIILPQETKKVLVRVFQMQPNLVIIGFNGSGKEVEQIILPHQRDSYHIVTFSTETIQYLETRLQPGGIDELMSL